MSHWTRLGIVAACVVAALLSRLLAPAAPAILLAITTMVALWLVKQSLPRPTDLAFFSPMGLAVAFLALATGLVPLLWALGWATPWDEIATDRDAAALLASAAFSFLAVGVILGRPERRLPYVILETPRGRLVQPLLVGLLIGAGGYLALAFLAGGPSALLHSLADRRDLLAGTGPIRILLVVSGIACLYGAMHRNKTGMESLLTWACGLTYLLTTLATGSRYQALVLVVAAVCARIRSFGISRSLWLKLALLVVAVVPVSTLYGIKVRNGLTYGTHVDVVDSTSTNSAIGSLVGPFAKGGLDTIRTTGVLQGHLPLFRFDLNLYLGSIGNIVPRSLWPGKPLGSATQFSELYFPSKWAAGTGVPPAMPAEFLHSFGLLGGLIGLAIAGFLLTRMSAWSMRRSTVFWAVFTPLLTADSIQLAKSGSDGFIRTVVIHVLACLIMTGVARSARTTAVATFEKVSAKREPSPAAVVRKGAPPLAHDRVNTFVTYTPGLVPSGHVVPKDDVPTR